MVAIPIRIPQCWSKPVVIIASGPSFTAEQAHRIGRARNDDRVRVVAVNDAVYPCWFADVCYACDDKWWHEHAGLPDYRGQRWSSHGHPDRPGKPGSAVDDKLEVAGLYGVRIVQGKGLEGFSTDAARIHYGAGSGFQAINLVHHFLGGKGDVILCGFDMRIVDGRVHFFGDHPKSLTRGAIYEDWVGRFECIKTAAPGLNIVNATPNSALKTFPLVALSEVLP